MSRQLWSAALILLVSSGSAFGATKGKASKENGLKLTEGLAEYQVFQRDKGDKADISFGGTCSASGPVEARILKDQSPLKGFDWKAVGKAADGTWHAKLTGVPVGGEYTIEARVAGGSAGCVVEHVLVGDLWLLAGQSNMDGVGDIDDRIVKPMPLLHSYESRERWAVAEEPLLWLNESPDAVHNKNWKDWPKNLVDLGKRRRSKGASLGMPFGAMMVKETGVAVGLVPCSHGGTSMAQWDPALKGQAGGSLYGSMLRRFHAVGGKVAGVLWYQGESDANPKASQIFAKVFTDFVAAVRSDFGDPDLPFYWVQIGRHIALSGEEDWNRVQEAQRVLPAKIPNTACVAAIDLELDDAIHIGTSGNKRLGRRLAKIALRNRFGRTQYQPGPQLKSVHLEADGRRVRITFEHVNGKLHPAEHIAGFSICDAKGALFQSMYDARVDPANGCCVLLDLQHPAKEGMVLWYGEGKMPYCNLVDCEDMAAMVAGPIPLKP